jgi:nucleoside-diphosphate-sugar epimerase
VTQREYLVAIAQELGAPAPRWHLPYRVGLALGVGAEITHRAARRDGPPPLTRFGIQLLGGENRFRIDRARTELGFAPDIMLSEGVKRSVEWYLMQSHGGG